MIIKNGGKGDSSKFGAEYTDPALQFGHALRFLLLREIIIGRNIVYAQLRGFNMLTNKVFVKINDIYTMPIAIEEARDPVVFNT